MSLTVESPRTQKAFTVRSLQATVSDLEREISKEKNKQEKSRLVAKQAAYLLVLREAKQFDVKVVRLRGS